MAKDEIYRYAVSISSQIPHCSLPLRLDSHSKCSFRCSYCFAKNRGGNHPPKGIKMIDEGRFERLMSNSLDSTKRKLSVTSQLIQRRVPFHFGGMSDPFMEYELHSKKTLETLRILKKYSYPTIISTKGVAVRQPEYLKLISDGLSVVQVSFSTLNPKISNLIEFNTPTPLERLNTISEVSSGCWVSARLQPLIPGMIDEAVESMHALASAGVKHISVELLKLPLVGSDKLLNLISNACKLDISKFYSDKRIRGLEYVVDNDYSLYVHKTLNCISSKQSGLFFREYFFCLS